MYDVTRWPNYFTSHEGNIDQLFIRQYLGTVLLQYVLSRNFTLIA